MVKAGILDLRSDLARRIEPHGADWLLGFRHAFVFLTTMSSRMDGKACMLRLARLDLD